MKKKLIATATVFTMLFSMLVFPELAPSAAAAKYSEPATDAELAAADQVSGMGGISAEIINGEAWVWGVNRNYALGITSTTKTDPNNPSLQETIAVNNNDTIPWATKIPSSVFGGEKLKKLRAFWAKTYAITESGRLYAWGRNDYNSVSLTTPASTDVQLPTEVLNADGSNPFGGYPVNDVFGEEHGEVVVEVQVSPTEKAWYLWGANQNGQCGTGTATSAGVTVPNKISENYILNEKIIDVKKAYLTTAFLTESGKVYTIGSNEGFGALGNNLGQPYETEVDTSNTALYSGNQLTPKEVSFGNAFTSKGKKIVQLQGAAREFAALDSDGCVWTWGFQYRGAIGNGNTGTGWIIINTQPKPYLAFGAEAENEATNTKKARKLYIGMDSFIVLCTDNTLFGSGLNDNYRFSMVEERNAQNSLVCSRFSQFMEDVSKNKTITHVRGDHNSVTVVTRTGDSFFGGSNVAGGAGTGDTVSPPAGEVIEPEPETLPPVKPTTANKVYLDIVYADREHDGALKTVTGAEGQPVTAKVDAGQRFTVKVYFEDFAKLDQFTLPLGFTAESGGDQGAAQVVYKSGSGDTEYAKYTGDENEPLDGSNIVNFSSSTGIQSNVKDSVWLGGSLTKNAAYPRINNQQGYVSVHGTTTQRNAPINGKQLMYSIDFIGTANGNVSFWIMDAQQTQEKGDPMLALDGVGGSWLVTRLLSGGSGQQLEASYDFNDDHAKFFPTVNVATHPLNSIALRLMYQKNGETDDVADTAEVPKAGEEAQKETYFVVDKKNVEDTFVVKAEPNPKNATDADIDSWSVEFDGYSGLNPSDKQVSDYIERVNSGTRSYTFKMPENTTTTQDAYFIITAKKAGFTIPPVRVKVASMTPPAAITIDNAGDCPNPFLVNDPVEELGLLSEFTYEATVVDTANTKNTNVTWALYNCVEQADGTTTETLIANNDLTAPAVLSNPLTVEGNPLKKTVQVKAQHSTPAGSYVKIRVESTAGSTVFDEATFRVELLSTGMNVPNEIYLGTGTSRQINIAPVPYDAFKPEYEFTVKANDTGRSYISVGENGLISADSTAPAAGVYDELVIREKKSDAYYSKDGAVNSKTVKTVKVYVLDIIEPPDMDVEAKNNVGTANDKVIFNADLKEGDHLTVYKEFMNSESLAAEYPALTKTQIAQLKEGLVFEDGLSATGGTIGYLVERTDGDFTEVPVSYTAEPCFLTGYARLEGKISSSPQNADIVVEIQGLRDADGNPVPAKRVQDETGYFEFENYVPVGTYTLKISRDLYITRYITVKVTGSRTEADIVVSTVDNPIYLAPGDLGNPKNNRVDPAEFQTYLYSWFGKTAGRTSGARFDDYNFREMSSTDSVIGMYDINLLQMYYNRENVYKDWIVTQ